jgi:type VI secretion system protein ImpK
MANDTDDPFGSGDGTVLRPRPGGGARRGTAGTAAPGMPSPPRQVPPGEAVRVPQNPAAIADFLTGGRNPILLAAAPLIAIASRLQTTVARADVASLRTQAMQEVRLFDDRLRAANVTPEDAGVARYILCTFFDSAVLNTPWGAQSDWSGQSLLVMFHKEKSGGEKFFQILERIGGQPARYIDLIELQYVCLMLGYEGMYRIQERGQERLAALEHELARTIRDARQLRDEDLAVRWRGVEDKRNPVFRYVPWWIVGAVSLAIIVLAFVIYDARLRSAAEPIKALLAQSSVPLVYQPAAPVQPSNRLKVLLAPEEQAGRVTVEDFGDKTIVTPTASDLFRSGSASVNPQHTESLRTVARALAQVPGKVVVVGHTDDQPVRSLQFADNFELSRERAVAVTRVLKTVLDKSRPVEWIGVGSAQPRYKPVDTAENRARNRRVEIIHVATGAAQ